MSSSQQHNGYQGLAEACVRSLADDAGVDVGAMPGSQAFSSDGEHAQPGLRAQRGALDALALQHAYHDVSLHRQLAPDHALERALFNVFEQERYESIGCNAFAGVQLNLDARDGQDACANGVLSDEPGRCAQTAPIRRLQLAVAALCRRGLRQRADTSLSHPDESNTVVNSTEYASLWPVFAQPLTNELRLQMADQQGFGLMVRALLDQWRRSSAVSESGDQVLEGLTEEGEEQDAANAASTNTDDDDEANGLADDEALAADDEAQARSEEEAGSEAAGESVQSDAVADQLMDEAPVAGTDPEVNIHGDPAPYKAYTTEFDEICHASAIADSQALMRWRDELDSHIDVHARLVRRLASRLQRVLLARQRRHWQFDMEEGHLDSARLSRIVTQPLMPLSFKCESEAGMRDTTITLLIDNSRSMLGRPIMIAAAATDILARTLERCGVSVEILGFSTVHLHGGRSTERWESEGKCHNPGRLNDLRHIIYKSADTPYRTARRHLSLMLDKDILKQNIDGEALLWAHGRLVKRAERRRILMMISDGAPVDTSTLGANAGDYLARHLQQVVDDIERAGEVELLAIGIGHDVSRFYSHALSVFDARQLGPAMLNELESLLRKAA